MLYRHFFFFLILYVSFYFPGEEAERSSLLGLRLSADSEKKSHGKEEIVEKEGQKSEWKEEQDRRRRKKKKKESGAARKG